MLEQQRGGQERSRSPEDADLSSLTAPDRRPGATERIIDQGMQVLKAVGGLSKQAGREESEIHMQAGRWQTRNRQLAPEQVSHVVVEIDRAEIQAAGSLPQAERKELSLRGHKTEEAALLSAYGRLIDRARSTGQLREGEPVYKQFRFTEDLSGVSISHGEMVVGVLPKNADAVVTFVREYGGGRYYNLEPYQQQGANAP